MMDNKGNALAGMMGEVNSPSGPVQEATEQEEAMLGQVLVKAVTAFKEGGKEKLLASIKQGADIGEEIGHFVFSVLFAIYNAAKKAGDEIPMSVFMGENAAVDNLVNIIADWLIRQGVQEAGSDVVLRKAVDTIVKDYTAVMDKNKGTELEDEAKSDMAEIQTMLDSGALDDMMMSGDD